MLKATGNQDQLVIFEQLFHAYQAKLHRYAFTLLKDTHTASDIVQQVFKKLWEKKDELLKEEAIRGYLYKATYNFCLNSLRDRQVRKQHTRAAAPLVAVAAGSARDKVMVSELAQRIQVITESLPHQCRLVFIKSRMEGKRYAEIAGELNISEKTVEVHIGKALKIFRAQLGDYLVLFVLVINLRS